MKRSKLLGVVCWLTYFSIYLGRLNFPASMSEILRTGLWEKGELGSVAAVFYLAYGLGQLPSGLLGDRLSTKWMIGIGVAGSALINGIFPAMKTAAGMQAIWFVNGLLQAMIWPPMVRLITDLAGAAESVRIILLLSFSSPAGMLGTYLGSAILLKYGSWQLCFFSASIWLAGVAIVWFVSISALERTNKSVGKTIQVCDTQRKAGEVIREKSAVTRFSLSAFVLSGFFWLMAAAFIHGVLKDGLTTWIPTYLTEEFAIRPSFSLLLTTVIPMISLCGVPLAQIVNRRWMRNEAAAGAVFYLVSLSSLLCMMGLPGEFLYGAVALFAIVIGMMTAINTLLISLLPLHFEKEGMVATISGGLNAVTYLGSAAASALFGYTTQYAGWHGTQVVWCGCAMAGAFFCTAAVKKWKRNRIEIYGEKEKKRECEKDENNTGIL